MTGDDLRAWRYAHHLTQVQLAELVSVTVLTIKRWESGKTDIPGHLRLALERLDQLLRSTPEETPA